MPRKRKEQDNNKPRESLDGWLNKKKIQEHSKIENNEDLQDHREDKQNERMQMNLDGVQKQQKREKRLLVRKVMKPSIEELKKIFSKESICLMGEFEPYLQIDIEHMLIVFGGKVSSQLGQDTTLVIKGRIPYKKQTFKKMQVNCLIKLANMKEIQIISSKNFEKFLKGRTNYCLSQLIEISNRVDCAIQIKGERNEFEGYVIQKVDRKIDEQKLDINLLEGNLRLRKYLQDGTSWAIETLSKKMTIKEFDLEKRMNLCNTYKGELIRHVQQNYLKGWELSSKEEFKHFVKMSRDFVDADVIGNCSVNFDDRKADMIDEQIFLGVVSPLQRMTQKLEGRLSDEIIKKNQRMAEYQAQRRLVKKIKNKISLKHSCSMFEVKNVMIPLICKTIKSLLDKDPEDILMVRRLMKEYGLEFKDIKKFMRQFVDFKKKFRLLE